jgi:hypothetical protein
MGGVAQASLAAVGLLTLLLSAPASGGAECCSADATTRAPTAHRL